MGNMGYNLENPVGCSEFLLPALKLAALQVTEHCGVLLEAQQQAEKNFLIICKKKAQPFSKGALVLTVSFV